MVRLLGLTGAIACGKSAVSERLTAAGCPVVDADKITHDLYKDKHGKFHQRVLAALGPSADVLDANGYLDRKKVSECVFADKAKLKALNSATHGLILKELFRQTCSHMWNGHRQIALDIPLLVKFPLLRRLCCSSLVVVYAPLEVQLERLMARNGFTRDEALKRITSQVTSDDLRKLADYVINNDGSIEDLDKRVNDFLLEQPRGWTAKVVSLALLAAVVAVGGTGVAALKSGLSYSASLAMAAAVASGLVAGTYACR
jgi:dephospho-CoA kinase